MSTPAAQIRLGTLFAEDARQMRRVLAASIGFISAIGVLGMLLSFVPVSILSDIGQSLGALSFWLLTPAVLGIMVAWYWQTMYTQQGYFTMALPVRGRTLYAAKVLFWMTVMALSALVSLIGIVANTLVQAMRHGRAFGDALSDLLSVFDIVTPVSAAVITVSLVIFLAYLVVSISAVMSIAAQGRFNRGGAGAALLGYLLLYVVMSIVALASVLFIPFGIRIAGPTAGDFVGQGMLDSFITAIQDPSNDDPDVLGLGILPVSLIVTALLAWWAVRVIEKRTSLR